MDKSAIGNESVSLGGISGSEIARFEDADWI
ncbi:MAG: hypothetical protein ACI8T1_004957 [Verrucomicrobiales bacterium]|jgi:hypothetical protein